MEKIIAYKPSCGCKKKTFRTKSACIAHENWCMYNPKNHSCPTCYHYDKDSRTCGMEIPKHNSDMDYVLSESLAKHCPYWKDFDENEDI
jgi:hypothetical protein